ncbi:MAG: 2-oxoglutarate dehydrogenase [Cytophagaceae bacterium]|jgi:2-oxoglutarate dehydrogenase E2 component (dihydrolipoamide succinyltransferase)|nr:2-oxoglutarate dehydrogenase [Cytophagaceae bacterium]
MALKEMVMPKMGESVMEGTILNWLKKVGDKIEQDESVLEVATDKVDTDVPATFGGTLKEILAEKGKVVAVGSPIAIIETGEGATSTPEPAAVKTVEPKAVVSSQQTIPPQNTVQSATPSAKPSNGSAKKFYSPLVMNIAREENISFEELERVNGTGAEGRVTKNDVIQYLEQRKNTPAEKPAVKEEKANNTYTAPAQETTHIEGTRSFNGEHEIIQMDRMRKMIADRMLESKRISPHVTSFVEADVTHIVYWRNRMKNEFMEKESAALTFTPIFIEAVVKAIKDYPMINVSVDEDKIIVKKDINIGMAVALPNGNLIVPVIKNADQLNIVGLTKKVNDLAKRARQNKLTADDLTGGTYTISNVGSFGNLMGTPIIVQPQCAILALGAVVKKPAVIETPEGDSLGIRHMMFLSHSYDHRVIDGSLGGMFVRRVADYLEGFDLSRKIF